MPRSRRFTVAIVDDEPEIRQLYAASLSDEYRIIEAGSGEAALEVVDDDVDVLLLDREMVDRSGDDVIESLRERGYDLSVAMVTASHPDLDILELGVDDYVVKPVGMDQIREFVETLLLRREYDEALRNWYAYASKLAAVRSSVHPDVLESDARFVRAMDQLEEFKRRAMNSLDAVFEAGKFEEVVRESPSTRRIWEEIDDDDDSEFSSD